MENDSHEPAPENGTAISTCRHDGWTGDKMATFCEALAETAVVAEACDQAGMGISGAYAHRRRSPVFAAAWDAALTIARERLADTLLARSMEGNVEQLYKDGELIGERHLLDNRLGLAILKRLDRLAETRMTVSTRGERFMPTVHAEQSRSAPALRTQPVDWEMMVGALRTGDPDDVAPALAVLKGHEVEEVEDPPVTLSPDAEDDNFLDLTDRCWNDGVDEIWMTDFPPPQGFAGWESRPYDEDDPDERYVRACTPQEIAILEADAAAARAAIRAEDEELRDAWFEVLRGEGNDRHPGLEPGSVCLPEPGEKARAGSSPA
jgi:hypothetical protein